MKKQNDKVVINTTEARGGTTGNNVNTVLTVSLTLAIIAGIVLVGAFWFVK